MESKKSFIKPDEMLKSLEELDNNLEKRKIEIAEKEAYEKNREVPLPEKVYHVTTKASAQQIVREGIDPSKLYFEDDTVVSLSDDINFAMNTASATQSTPPKNLVVLEIDTRYLTPSRIRNYLRSEDPENPNTLEGAAIHELHYESTVPPEAIRIIPHNPKK